jgi:amino acid permease
MEIIKCPKCQIADTTVYSKRKYFIRFGISVIAMLLGTVLVYGLYGGDIAPQTIVGFFFGAILSFTSLFFVIFYFIRAILKKETSYKCNHCKYTANSGFIFIVQDYSDEELMNTVRKRK